MKNSKNNSAKTLFLKKETVTILNKTQQVKLVGGAGLSSNKCGDRGLPTATRTQ